MLKKIKEIDRFYYFLGGILTVGAILAILILRTIFSAFATASSSAEGDGSNIPRLDKAKLEEVYEKLYEKTPPQLDL